MIRKAAFVEATGFDGKFFLYLDDPDLSWRFRLNGWEIKYVSAAEVAHNIGGTTGGREVTPLRLYYCQRNLLRSIIKNCGSSLGWALRNYLLFTLLMIGGFLLYDRSKAFVILRGIAWNILNLKSTYALRLWVQSRRRVSESDILRHMYPPIARKQPLDHSNFRRVLNTLFEYGGSRVFRTAVESQQK